MSRFLAVAVLMLGGCLGDAARGGGADENAAGDYMPDAALSAGGDAVVANTGGVGLNLRTGASQSDAVLLVMPEGAQVHVLGGPSSGYYQVTYQAQNGWAFGAYLRGVAMPTTTVPPKGDSSNNTPSQSLGGMYPATKWTPASASNFTAGREGAAIKYVVIHDMEGSYASAISWFENSAAAASAHYCVRSSDGEITQMVKEADTAWHAGNWTYNTESVGIEHEGYASQPDKWYTATMYKQSAKLTAALCHRYKIPVDRTHIFGHAEVPDPNNPGEFGGAGHHTDPGSGWDWDQYIALVKSYY